MPSVDSAAIKYFDQQLGVVGRKEVKDRTSTTDAPHARLGPPSELQVARESVVVPRTYDKAPLSHTTSHEVVETTMVTRSRYLSRHPASEMRDVAPDHRNRFMHPGLANHPGTVHASLRGREPVHQEPIFGHDGSAHDLPRDEDQLAIGFRGTEDPRKRTATAKALASRPHRIPTVGMNEPEIVPQLMRQNRGPDVRMPGHQRQRTVHVVLRSPKGDSLATRLHWNPEDRLAAANRRTSRSPKQRIHEIGPVILPRPCNEIAQPPWLRRARPM